MAPKIRVGVAGTGSFTRRVVVPGLRDSGVAEVVAIFGRTLEHAARVAQEAGIPQTVESFAELVRSPEIDAVAICTPNFQHAAMSMESLEGGKLVICEKPLGVDSRETRALALKARELGRRTCVNFTYRSMPAFMLAHQMIAAGEIGEIISGHVNYLQANWADPATPLDWRMQARESGGGVLADLGPHVIDLILWYAGAVVAVAGADAVLVKSRPSRAGGQATPTAADVAAFICDTGGGRLFSLHLSKLAWGHANQINMTVVGTKGSLRLFHERGQEVALALARAGTHDFSAVDLPPQMRVGFAQFPAHHMRRIARALLGQEDFPNFEDGHRAQCVIDAVQRSRQDRCWVDVEDRI